MTIIYHICSRFPRAKLHEIPAVKLCKTQIHREMGKKALTEVKSGELHGERAERGRESPFGVQSMAYAGEFLHKRTSADKISRFMFRPPGFHFSGSSFPGGSPSLLLMLQASFRFFMDSRRASAK